MKIAHTSDPHIGGHPLNAPRLRQLALHIRARHDGGEEIACAVTGDLTDDSMPEQWASLAWALEPLRGHVPLWLVEGNHDVGRLGVVWDATRAERARSEIGELADAPLRSVRGLRVWEWGGCKILGVDSTRGRAALARGEIGAEQLAALEVELQEVQPTVILLHHHPRWRDPGHVLEDAGALSALLQRRLHVKAVLYGHQHVEQTWGAEGERRWLSSGKSTDLTADGRLQYRTLELTSGRVQTVTIAAP